MIDFSDPQYYPHRRTRRTELNLRQEALTDDDIRALVEFLNQHPEITTLVVCNNKIGDTGAKLLATTTTITTLDLDNNQVGLEGIKALAANTTIARLFLGNNQVGDEGAKVLAANTTITTLLLIKNQVGLEGIKALAANTTITKLYLNRNQVGDEGALALAATTSIVELILYDNKIGVKGAKALASNYIITSLHLEASIGEQARREGDPIKRTNMGRSVGVNAPVPSLKRQALYQVQQLQKKGLIPPEELEMLPPDLIQALSNPRP